jgi:hypothetical protein
MRGSLIPLIVTVCVAVVGAVGILLSFGPGNNSQGTAIMITAAAVSKAGATQTPTEPLAIAGP